MMTVNPEASLDAVVTAPYQRFGGQWAVPKPITQPMVAKQHQIAISKR